MKKIILLLALAATQAIYSQTRIRNQTDVTLKVKINWLNGNVWNADNSETVIIKPDEAINIYKDGQLIKYHVQVWYNKDENILPYDEKENINPAWENSLTQAVDYILPNGTLNQAIRIIGSVDPKTQILKPKVINRPTLDLNNEEI